MGLEVRIRLRWCSGEREHREAFGRILLEPYGQFRVGVAVAGDDVVLGRLGLGQAVCRPDRFQLLADALAGLGVGRVVDGVPGEVELAALPCRAAKDRPVPGS